MKKGIKIAFIAIAGIIASFLMLAAAFLALFSYNNQYRLTDIDESVSPGGQYTVCLQMVGQPDWPFGAATAKVTVKETANGRVIDSFEASVHDDGVAPSPGHWEVIWEERVIRITLDGSEQQPQTYTVSLP